MKLSKPASSRFTVVCFLGTECPLTKLYGLRLAGFAAEFEPLGVRFIAINSNQHDSLDEVREFAAGQGIHFAVAKDDGNVVADHFGAVRTPHVFVLDEELVIRYRGRIDDQYLPGITRASAAREDLRIALDELLAGREVSLPATEPTGCFIGREKRPDSDSGVTYANQISRVLQQHCVECHRPGEIGPFSLTDYDEVVGWADTILEVIEDGRMPPWHASPDHGQFTNTRYMPESDRQLLREWVAAGVPYGNANDLPEPATFVDGWQLPREPDLVLPMGERPFTVPVSGTVEYQYFVVDPHFTEEKWVRAAQVVPGNRSVVHHGIVFIRPPDGSVFRGVGWLSAYVPGQRAYAYPTGSARRVPAGSKLVFQMHYTPTGTEQSDLTRVGLVFGEPEQVTHEVVTLIAIDQGFEIPPHEANYRVETRVRSLPEDGNLLAIMPHMHLRGKAFELIVERGDTRDTLLDVPRYDFNWQHIYQLAEPLPLAGIAGLECEVAFDNSAENPANPDPSQYVTWGDQTWEEMAVAFFDVSVPLERDEPAAAGDSRRAPEEADGSPKRVESFVTRFVNRFDANGDGEVEREETPRSLRAFGFRQLDLDADDRLTPDEIRELARRRIANP